MNFCLALFQYINLAQSRMLAKYSNSTHGRTGWVGGGGGVKPVGQYSLYSRAILAYYKKIWAKLYQFFLENFIILGKLVCLEKFWYVRKNFGTLRGGGGKSSKKILSGKIFWHFRKSNRLV